LVNKAKQNKYDFNWKREIDIIACKCCYVDLIFTTVFPQKQRSGVGTWNRKESLLGVLFERRKK
jgi:hypothetical protein